MLKLTTIWVISPLQGYECHRASWSGAGGRFYWPTFLSLHFLYSPFSQRSWIFWSRWAFSIPIWRIRFNTLREAFLTVMYSICDIMYLFSFISSVQRYEKFSKLVHFCTEFCLYSVWDFTHAQLCMMADGRWKMWKEPRPCHVLLSRRNLYDGRRKMEEVSDVRRKMEDGRVIWGQM